MPKSSKLSEARLLAILQRILPQKIDNPHLANDIYEGVVKEVRLFSSLDSFEKFCEKGSLPDCEPATVSEFKSQLDGNFGTGNVAVTPREDGTAIAVEIALPDHVVNTEVKIIPIGEETEEVKIPFVPFPVSLPDDPDPIW